jgi:uncharacterized protein (DUF427 family)
MSTRLRDVLTLGLGDLRHEPTDKRIRANFDGRTIIDSTRAVLVWEPKRIVPSYAVPADDIDAGLDDATETGAVPPADLPRLGDRPVYDPSIPFSVHTAEGEPVTIRSGDREAAGFRLHDEQLDGYVIVDFAGFDEWYEEDERNFGHPRDPFHRIDIVHSTRHVRVEIDGETVAESSNPIMLFEPPLPPRFYLAPEDVRTDLLSPSDKRTYCAYKGQASYWSLSGADDVAWTYVEPLREAAEVTGRIAFFNERVDIVVDGEVVQRPVTPWSPR